jgi:hypothetical protein
MNYVTRGKFVPSEARATPSAGGEARSQAERERRE